MSPRVKKKRNEMYPRYKKYAGFWVNTQKYPYILLYKQVHTPEGTYSIQSWGCTKQSNTQMI